MSESQQSLHGPALDETAADWDHRCWYVVVVLLPQSTPQSKRSRPSGLSHRCQRPCHNAHHSAQQTSAPRLRARQRQGPGHRAYRFSRLSTRGHRSSRRTRCVHLVSRRLLQGAHRGIVCRVYRGIRQSLCGRAPTKWGSVETRERPFPVRLRFRRMGRPRGESSAPFCEDQGTCQSILSHIRADAQTRITKGRAEKYLTDLSPSSGIRASIVRPGWFHPTKADEHLRSATARVLHTLFAPIIKWVWPSIYTPVEAIGQLTVEIAKGRWSEEQLFRNVRLRELMVDATAGSIALSSPAQTKRYGS